MSTTRLSLLAVLLLLTACASPLDDKEPIGSNGPAVMRIADTMLEQGQPEMAARFYTRSSELMPANPEPEMKLARLLAAAGNHEGALPHFEEALKREPDDANAHYDYGRALLQLDHADEAVAQFKLALDHDRRDPRANNALGAALDQLGRHGEAQPYYHEALRNGADAYITNTNLARSLLFSGRPEEAVAILEPLKTQSKATPPLRQTLAMAYDQLGQTATAQTLLSQDMNAAAASALLADWQSQRIALRQAADTVPASQTEPAVEAAPTVPVQKEPAAPPSKQNDWISWTAPLPPPANAKSEQAKPDQLKALPKTVPPPAPAPQPVAPAPTTAENPPPVAPRLQLGRFTTPGVAEGQLNYIKTLLADDTPPLHITPELSGHGAPHFVLETAPLKTLEAAQAICDRLQGKDVSCLILTGTR